MGSGPLCPYQLSLRYTLHDLSGATPEMLADITRHLQAGYVALIRFCQGDTVAAEGHENMVKYTSDFLSPRFSFDQPGKLVAETEERVWIRNVFGVASVLRANVSTVGPWESPRCLLKSRLLIWPQIRQAGLVHRQTGCRPGDGIRRASCP